jgi:hypothetical protein
MAPVQPGALAPGPDVTTKNPFRFRGGDDGDDNDTK